MDHAAAHPSPVRPTRTDRLNHPVGALEMARGLGLCNCRLQPTDLCTRANATTATTASSDCSVRQPYVLASNQKKTSKQRPLYELYA
jgi:hypothetical protein